MGFQSASGAQPPTINWQGFSRKVSAALHASAVAPASGHLLRASACAPWVAYPETGRVGGRKRDPLGSDPVDAHGSAYARRAHDRLHGRIPQDGTLLNVAPIPAQPSARHATEWAKVKEKEHLLEK